MNIDPILDEIASSFSDEDWDALSIILLAYSTKISKTWLLFLMWTIDNGSWAQVLPKTEISNIEQFKESMSRFTKLISDYKEAMKYGQL